MFNLFRKLKKQMEFENQFIVMMNKTITQIELQMEKGKWDFLSCSGAFPNRDADWLMLCRRFIDLINKIKKDKKSK